MDKQVPLCIAWRDIDAGGAHCATHHGPGLRAGRPQVIQLVAERKDVPGGCAAVPVG